MHCLDHPKLYGANKIMLKMVNQGTVRPHMDSQMDVLLLTLAS